MSNFSGLDTGLRDIAAQQRQSAETVAAKEKEIANRITLFANQVQSLAQRYENLRKERERERTVLQQTKKELETVKTKLKAAEATLKNQNNELSLLRKTGQELKELKNTTKAAEIEAHSSQLRHGFVLVLVDADADAYLFNDKYYEGKTKDGGEKAARDLSEAVQQHLRETNSILVGMPVVIRVFASRDGLVHLFNKAGMNRPNQPSATTLALFASGFSQADDLCDFVFVGAGKERVDNKLTASLRLFIDNPYCHQVVLACCHDNGYVRVLEKLDPTAGKKVTLIKSYAIGAEYKKLSFDSFSLPTIFRTGPLESKRSRTPSGSSLGSSSGSPKLEVAPLPSLPKRPISMPGQPLVAAAPPSLAEQYKGYGEASSPSSSSGNTTIFKAVITSLWFPWKKPEVDTPLASPQTETHTSALSADTIDLPLPITSPGSLVDGPPSQSS